MSTILLTNHNENIYNIIKREEAKPPPKLSEKSPFIAKLLAAEGRKYKFCHKTFGFAEVPLNKPSEYLKKNTRIFPPCPKIDERCLLSHRRPRVSEFIQDSKTLLVEKKPGKKCPYETDEEEPDEDVLEEEKKRKDGRNFCHDNVVQAIRLAARHPKRNYVDTKKGDAHLLLPSGLEPHYIKKKNYGKIPRYLHVRQTDAEKAKKEMQAEINRFKPEGRYITEPERIALLEGLKHNWNEIQKAYQLLPILTDTIPKKKHKTKLEDELKQLEGDIRTLERHPHIYVTDADCSVFSYDPDSD